MKAKLLRKARNRVKLYERNGMYYVKVKENIFKSHVIEVRFKMYRYDNYNKAVLSVAKRIFKFTPKSRIR